MTDKRTWAECVKRANAKFVAGVQGKPADKPLKITARDRDRLETLLLVQMQALLDKAQR